MKGIQIDRNFDKVLRIASKGDIVGIKNLLKEYPQIINRPSEGHNRTILWEAVNKNRIPLADFLIQKGANVNIPGRYRSQTYVLLKPYCIAVRNKNERLQNLILSNGHQMDIYSLSYLGKVDELQHTIKENKNLLNLPHKGDNQWNVIPLHFALVSKNIETIKVLLKLGSEVKAHSKLLYDIACRTNQIEAIQLLTNYGGRPQEADVFSVFYNSNDEVINYFVDNGLNCDKYTNLGWPAIVYLCRGDKGEHPEKVKKLIKHVRNIDAQTPNGVSALHAASKAGYLSVAEILLQNGSKINIRDNKGKTPLSYSRRYKRKSMEDFLIKNGAIE